MVYFIRIVVSASPFLLVISTQSTHFREIIRGSQKNLKSGPKQKLYFELGILTLNVFVVTCLGPKQIGQNKISSATKIDDPKQQNGLR